MKRILHIAIPVFSALTAYSQSCQNYGTPNGSSCSCPPGFGGASCELLACGGTLFASGARPFAEPVGNGRSNSSSCKCEDGWGGTGCNVCQTSRACQTAFDSVHSNSSAPGVGIIPDQFQNMTMTCNAQPRVYAAGEMSCKVVNPTLQGVFPLESVLNILRSLNTSLTPIPGATSFGDSGSIYAQLIYDGVEQFYCTANKCTQAFKDGSDWNCQNLKCTCIQGTEFCGGGTLLSLTTTINTLNGTLDITCDNSPSSGSSNSSSPQNLPCFFKQELLNQLFGDSGLNLTGCSFGECIQQFAIDASANITDAASNQARSELSGGVIAGLAVVGTLLAGALLMIVIGKIIQHRAKKDGPQSVHRGGVGVKWENVGYLIPRYLFFGKKYARGDAEQGGWTEEGKVVLHPNGMLGSVKPGEMLAILGPSGAGKTTFVEILAGKRKIGKTTGKVEFFDSNGILIKRPRVGFVDQGDTLPPNLTPREALLFAANLRLPESIPHVEKQERVSKVLSQLGLDPVADTRIGNGEKRGISGGEMRRVSLGCELVAGCDIIVLDEPTSGLDSVSAAKVTTVLHEIANDPENPTAVIASIHQPNSKLYMTFSHVLLFSEGHVLYLGKGALDPVSHFVSQGFPRCPEGYNVADWLLDIASEPNAAAKATGVAQVPAGDESGLRQRGQSSANGNGGSVSEEVLVEKKEANGENVVTATSDRARLMGGRYATTFLTQFEVLAGREWKSLKRDKTLFFTHVGISCVLGVFVGGLYFKTGITIAGFQSRIGCLFFLGALIAFSSLSALYNLVEVRPIFLRERAAGYYSPTAWLLSRLVFDVIPLRILPTIIVSTITYWMTGLAPDAAHFFKFLFILVLYTIAMTLFNFLLACVFRNGGIAILLSALTALYQQTYAGFFVHLDAIPPVLRWLQWLAPLKYTLEALSVNEVGSGLMIRDTLQGVPVAVSASLIMNLLFGFGSNNYYRDVLVLFAFIAGFGLMVIFVVWFNVRERR